MRRISWLMLVWLIATGAFVTAQETSDQTPYQVVYVNDAGELVGFDPQTSEASVLLPLGNPLEQGYGFYPSPDGQFLAVYVRTQTANPQNPFTYQLYLLQNQQVIGNFELLPADYVYPVPEQLGDPQYELTRALGEIVWSPNSQFLAFISGAGGTGAELVIYEPATQTLTELSQATGTAAFLSWNPSGTGLVWADLTTFGNGSGYQVGGYNFTETDGTQTPLTVDPATIPNGLAVLGWWDDQTLAYSPYDFTLFGASGLFRYDLTTATSTPLLPTTIRLNLPVFDPESGTLAFVVPDVSEGGLVPGAYLWQAEASEPQLVQTGTFYTVELVRAGLFQAESPSSSLLIPVDGLNLVSLPTHAFGAYLSPVAERDVVVLARADGVYLSRIQTDDATLVWADQTQVPIWSPDGTRFYSYGFLNDQAGLIEVDTLTRQARLLDTRMAVSSPRGVMLIP